MGCLQKLLQLSLPPIKSINMDALSQPMTAEPSQRQQELAQRLDLLRTHESFCDVTIKVKGKEFKAHRVVLAAASPFFLTLLTSDMRESNEQVIKIELEEATAPVMEDVLKYIYTGNATVADERAHNLFATADYLLLPGLKTMAGNVLTETITVENCIFNYYFSRRYQYVQLIEQSSEVINLNFSVVMEAEDFLNLDVKQVMDWVSSDDITVSAEEEVFKGIVKWVSHNKSERECHFRELLHQVRLASVSHDFLVNELVKEELIMKDPEFGLNFVVDVMKLTLNTSDEQANQQPRKCLEKHKDGIFVCGGRKALCYFPQLDVWYRLADTLFDHNKQAPVHWKGNVYIGGICNVGKSQVIEYYVPTTNSMGTIQQGVDVPEFSCLAVFKGDLYAMHFDRSFLASSLGRIFRYDAETNCWNAVMDLPKRHGFSACVVADEKHLYIIGGVKGNNIFSTTTRLNLSNNTWEEVADINEGRCNAFGVAMSGKVFIAGGRQSCKQAISSCEVYSPSTDEWQLMPSLKVPRFSASMVCCKGRLYVVGGTFINHLTREFYRALTVEEFDPCRNQWKQNSAGPVKNFETSEEEEKKYIFQACSTRFYKGVIDKLEPLN